ncbi:MAG: hypothetical protein JXR10_17325 [Cyclobacteriaceae bacterium]
MEKILLTSHAVSGGVVLVLGLINMLNRKGSKNHLLLGKIYVGTMWWICLSAFSIITFYRFSFFLLVVGILTFYSSFSGVRVVRRKSHKSKIWYDWVVNIITVLFGIGLILYGIHYMLSVERFAPLGILSVIFGGLTSTPAVRALRNFTSNKEFSKQWWLDQHISAMSGSYVAAITAFAVQNSSLFLPDNILWLSWILPAVVLSPVIRIMRKKYVPNS